MAHSASTTRPEGSTRSVSTTRSGGSARPEEPSIGTLAQRAMSDVSTLIRSEVELAKAEIGRSAKKAGISAGAFGAAGVVIAFSAFFFFIAVAEFLTWLGLPRWVSYLIVWAFLVLVGAIAGFVGMRMAKKVEKPERTIETLRDLPEVAHREAPGARHRDVPTVTDGKVRKPGSESYTL